MFKQLKEMNKVCLCTRLLHGLFMLGVAVFIVLSLFAVPQYRELSKSAAKTAFLWINAQTKEGV